MSTVCFIWGNPSPASNAMLVQACYSSSSSSRSHCPSNTSGKQQQQPGVEDSSSDRHFRRDGTMQSPRRCLDDIDVRSCRTSKVASALRKQITCFQVPSTRNLAFQRLQLFIATTRRISNIVSRCWPFRRFHNNGFHDFRL